MAESVCLLAQSTQSPRRDNVIDMTTQNGYGRSRDRIAAGVKFFVAVETDAGAYQPPVQCAPCLLSRDKVTGACRSSPTPA